MHIVQLMNIFERNDRVEYHCSLFTCSESGKRKHWSKIILSPLWSFFNGYFLRLGFLDGYYGFIIARKPPTSHFLKYQNLNGSKT